MEQEQNNQLSSEDKSTVANSNNTDLSPPASVPTSPESTNVASKSAGSSMGAEQINIEAKQTKQGTQNQYAVSLRNIVLKALLGMTVATAVITIALILIGTWNDATWRAIWTMVTAIIHLGITLGIVSANININIKTDERRVKSDNALINVILGLSVVSFFTSVMSTWSIIAFDKTVYDIYISIFYILMGSVHVKVLYDTVPQAPNAHRVTQVNYGVTAFLVVLAISLQLVEGMADASGGFFVRLAAASAVLTVTLSVVIAVMRNIYLQTHPELRMVRIDKNALSPTRQEEKK